MLTRALLVLTLLFGVFAMHQVAQPSDVHGVHGDHDPGLHLCLGLVVTVAGLVVLRKAGASGTRVTPPPARAAAVQLPRPLPVVADVPTRLVVLRL